MQSNPPGARNGGVINQTYFFCQADMTNSFCRSCVTKSEWILSGIVADFLCQGECTMNEKQFT